MFRTPLLAVATAALLSGTALTQTAFAQSSNSGAANSAPRDLSDGPPSASADGPDDYDAPPATSRTAEADHRSRDLFCRRDAAARTGYVTPGDAARDEQTRGTIGGTLGGAILGAVIGGAAGNAGTGAAVGAGAGLLAGTAVGSSNAREAAADVRAAYGHAYYACMDEARIDPEDTGYYDDGYDGAPPPPPAYYGYGYGPPPPPPVYYGYRSYGYPYYPYYYGPSVGFSVGIGGGRGWHGHRGGWRHR